MGVTEMASILNQHQLGNDCNDGEQILQQQPDQTDTIDGKCLPVTQRPTYNSVHVSLKRKALARMRFFVIIKKKLCTL